MMKSFAGGMLMAGVLLLGIATASAAKDPEWKPTPLMRTVDPDTAKAGTTVTITGEHLDKTGVAAVYLTDGKNEIKTEILQQTGTEMKIRIPAQATPGRLRLMVLTTGAQPQFLEQPVTLSIE